MEVNFTFINSKKDLPLVSKGLTSLFFVCQGGTIRARMDPKEEKMKIITEVSG